MTRGERAMVGQKFKSRNGYNYIRTLDGWRLEHHVVAEKTLGRSIDTSMETAYFIDKNPDNLSPENIGVRPKKGRTKEYRIAVIKAKIQDLQAQLEELEHA